MKMMEVLNPALPAAIPAALLLCAAAWTSVPQAAHPPKVLQSSQSSQSSAAAPAMAADTFEMARSYPPGSGELRLEISRSQQELHIHVGGELVRTLPVAVGQPDHPTPTGEWGIHQVDWNPDWTPPDSEWAEDSDYKAPGEDGNPMGRARLIFRAPYSIHGTDVIESLGERASHGSVRVSNEHVLDLARLVQEHGGVSRSEEWYRNAVGSPAQMFEVSLPDPVPIRIRD